MGPDEVIVFDTVTTNIGGAYSNRTGHFTAPTNGIYEFAVTIMSMPHSSVHVAIAGDTAINSGELCRAYGAFDGFDSGTCVATAHLGQGYRVWVKHIYSNTTDTIDHANYSIFSGNLIRLM
jgi:hypothetical protein